MTCKDITLREVFLHRRGFFKGGTRAGGRARAAACTKWRKGAVMGGADGTGGRILRARRRGRDVCARGGGWGAKICSAVHEGCREEARARAPTGARGDWRAAAGDARSTPRRAIVWQGATVHGLGSAAAAASGRRRAAGGKINNEIESNLGAGGTVSPEKRGEREGGRREKILRAPSSRPWKGDSRWAREETGRMEGGREGGRGGSTARADACRRGRRDRRRAAGRLRRPTHHRIR
jgi:hypothetical protein